MLAQAVADLIAIDARQHDVENDGVKIFGGGQVQTGQAIQGPFYFMPLELQELNQVVMDVPVVFNHQNTHRITPSASR
ncbi:hypothetical protein D3C76_1099260 [compost metagenome]